MKIGLLDQQDTTTGNDIENSVADNAGAGPVSIPQGEGIIDRKDWFKLPGGQIRIRQSALDELMKH